ncbi:MULTISPECIES: MFS transporter [unclassified Streptomyces]|uniref:MFS transporter n=1 Tax=unclassified Streptomyces TaxID=2593676 RepID=UPI001660540B|nr:MULTISPECIES: MFS transporter [unclassified Streptomyces]MBD0711518.1 MFS transporter [Streptomyces sp. CBMA291]MBD0716522.1 MFS transporter [Streptomyces sp. CBMA370]
MPAPSVPSPPPAAADRGAPGKRAVRTTVVLLFAAWLIDYADRLVINFVLPSIGEEFHLTRGQQGLIVSAFFLAYALAQVPGGMLTDRFGARRVTLWALLSWSLFTALTGFAWSFAALLLMRFAFGAAEGVFPPAAMKVLVERTAPAERMGANGVIMSSNAFAAILVPLSVAPLVAVFGWRSAFFSTAALGVLVIVAIRAWLPASRPLTEPEAEAAPEANGQPWRLRDVLRFGVLWRFAAMMFGYNVVTGGLITWAPSYLSTERGVPLASSGLLLVLPALAGAAATIIGGRLADRLGGHHRKVIVPGMAVAAIALPLMAYSPSLIGFVAFATLVVFAASLAYMPIFAVPLSGLPSACLGVGSAVIVLGGQLAGMITPPLVGALADSFSFPVAFTVTGVGAIIASAMAFLTPQDADAFRAVLPRPRTTLEQS